MSWSIPLCESRLLRDRAYIDGVWITGERCIEVVNPADSLFIGSVPNLGSAETEQAIAAADRAFATWRDTTAKSRSSLLRHWHDLILEHKDDLATILTAEQGKPLAESRSEVAYAAAFIEWFAEEAKRVTGDILTPHQADRTLLVKKEPIGIVAAITPWNFPLAMVTRKVGPALAVGCTMVLKPSELTPLSALALAWLAEQAGIPAGVFNVVTGDAEPIGDVLLQDRRVRKLTFTGSTKVGKMLGARSMATVKRLSLELGGNAPLIVFDDADLEVAVEGAMASKFRNAGQTCVCANRLLVQSGIYDAFAKKLAERVRSLVVGPGLEGRSDQGPLINHTAVEKVEQHVADALKSGASILVGGRRIEGDGHFFEPTVLIDVAATAMLCREETFGPVAGLVRFDDDGDAIRLANSTDAGLAAYVFTRSLERSWSIPNALDYGMIGLNTGIISTEVAPFGGIKESGFGREGSSRGVDDYLQLKTLCLAVPVGC